MPDEAETNSLADPDTPQETTGHTQRPRSAGHAAYALASGRTVLLLRFYEMRKQEFPDRFRAELVRISQLGESDGARSLEALNDRILADMTSFLSIAAQSMRWEKGESFAGAEASRELIDDLILGLTKDNPYFAMWVRYTGLIERLPDAEPWHQFVRREIEDAGDDDLEFALLMEQLGKLLHIFRDRQQALPPYYFERVWFLHYLEGAERSLQTRALVQGLVEAMESCGSAS